MPKFTIEKEQLLKLQKNIRETISICSNEANLNQEGRKRINEIKMKITEKENVEKMISAYISACATEDSNEPIGNLTLERFQNTLNNNVLNLNVFKIHVLEPALKQGKLSGIEVFAVSFAIVVALGVPLAICIAMPVLILPVAAIILFIIAGINFFYNKSIESACNKTNEFFAESLGLQKNGEAAFTSRSRTVFFNSKDNTRDALSEKRNTYDDDLTTSLSSIESTACLYTIY